MPRKYTLTATSLGVDTDIVDIYHTSVTAGNLLTSSISASSLLTGVELIVNDNTSSFIVVNSSTACSGSSGSVDEGVYEPNTRFFELIVADTNAVAAGSGTGSISISSPTSAGPSSTSLTQTVDFDAASTFTTTATGNSNYDFTGWYTSSLTSSGALISTNATLNITENAYTHSLREDRFYAVFSYNPPATNWSVTGSLTSGFVTSWKVIYDYGGVFNVVHDLDSGGNNLEDDRISGNASTVDITVYKVTNAGVAQDAGNVSARVIGGSVQQDIFNTNDNIGSGNPFTYTLNISPFQPGAQVEVIIEEG
jgi:hypothetical protein